MKTIHIIFKVILSIILIMPIIGALGLMPASTAEMYNNSQSFAFMQALMDSKYILNIMSLVFILALICLWTRRELLAALLILPITVNIVGFHAYLDGGLLLAGAMIGNILALLNIYFLWRHRAQLASIVRKS